MTPTSTRICLALILLGLVAAALFTGLRARHDGITIKAHIAAMQLQGMPEVEDHAAAVPDKDDAIERCLIGAAACATAELRQGLVVVSGDLTISKAMAAPAAHGFMVVQAVNIDNNDEARVPKHLNGLGMHILETKRER